MPPEIWCIVSCGERRGGPVHLCQNSRFTMKFVYSHARQAGMHGQSPLQDAPPQVKAARDDEAGCSAERRLAAQRSTAACDSSMANGRPREGGEQHIRHGACNRASTSLSRLQNMAASVQQLVRPPFPPSTPREIPMKAIACSLRTHSTHPLYFVYH